jgi:HSP20 family protein
MTNNNVIAPAEQRQTAETRAVTLTPRVDVFETEDGFTVLADLPGVVPGDVDIRFENGELTVHARRSTGQPLKGEGWEFEAMNYYRSFRLSDDIAADRIEAELKTGVLTLKLPKVEAVKPRRIAVKG